MDMRCPRSQQRPLLQVTTKRSMGSETAVDNSATMADKEAVAAVVVKRQIRLCERSSVALYQRAHPSMRFSPFSCRASVRPPAQL